MEHQEPAGHRVNAGRPIGTLFLFPCSVIEVCDVRQAHFIRPVQAEFPSQQVLLPVPLHELPHALPGRVLTANLCPDPVLPQEPAYLADGEGLPCQVRHHHIYLTDSFLKAFVFHYHGDLLQIAPVPFPSALVCKAVTAVIQSLIVNGFRYPHLLKDLTQAVSTRIAEVCRVLCDLPAQHFFLHRGEPGRGFTELCKAFVCLTYQGRQPCRLDPADKFRPFHASYIRRIPFIPPGPYG